jgi:hypothetical protein
LLGPDDEPDDDEEDSRTIGIKESFLVTFDCASQSGIFG